MSGFVALNLTLRLIKRAEAELRVDSSLDGAMMILFNDIVDMRNGTAARASTQCTGALQFLNHGWIGGISSPQENRWSRRSCVGAKTDGLKNECFQRSSETTLGAGGRVIVFNNLKVDHLPKEQVIANQARNSIAVVKSAC
jgi:hypothetical protein